MQKRLLRTQWATCALLCVGLLSCGADPAPKPEKARAKVADPFAKLDEMDSSEYQMQLTDCSWGQEQPKPAPPRPQVVSKEEGQRQKFQREAAKRWKNTEIFVLKSHR